MAAPMVKIDGSPGFYRRGGRVVFAYRDTDGRQRWGSGRNIAEAKRLKAKAVADVERGEWSETCRVPFCDYAVQWLDTYRGRTPRGLSDTTRAGYGTRSNVTPSRSSVAGASGRSERPTCAVTSPTSSSWGWRAGPSAST